MRFLFALSVLSMLAFSLVSNAESHEPKMVPIALTRAHIPPGFDDNDRAQVVVSGVFPNSCYKVGPLVIKRDEKTNTIKLRQLAYFYRGLCFEVTIPFSRVVDLGILPAGDHALINETGNEALGTLKITRATSDSADEGNYAPVYDLFPYSDKPGESMLFLAGTYPAKCFKLAKVEVKYHGDVIEVLPSVELASREAADCRPQAIPFTHRLKLKDGLKGTYLIHLRSMDGQAVNKLAEFPLPHASP